MDGFDAARLLCGTGAQHADQQTCFLPSEHLPARAFLDREGYVVLRGILTAEQCDAVTSTFDREVRASRVPILRQKNMRYEVNAFTPDGFLANPIFNVQDLQSTPFGAFKTATLDALTSPAVASTAASLLRTERAKIVQSMFFEAPAGTWAHQDSYYQDSAAGLGNAVAGWFALEDIDPGAGRFFVCPGSHRSVAVLKNAGEINFASGHEAYKRAVSALLEAQSIPVVAPALRKGDAVFWNSLTIHGSYPAQAPGKSRLSLTAHYLRERDDMLQFHSHIRRQSKAVWNGMQVGLLHDQDLLRNRIVRDLAFRFPSLYMTARRTALRLLAHRRGQGRGQQTVLD